MSGSQRLRGVLATVLMATGVSGAWGQQTAATLAYQKISLDIPSQPIAEALTALGQQSGLTIMLAAAVNTNAVSPAIVGDYTPDEALRKILAHSALKAEYLDKKTIAIRTAATAPTPTKEPTVDKKKSASPDKSEAAPAPPSGNSENEPQTRNVSTSEEQKGIAEILIRGSRTMNVDVVRTQDDVQPYTIFDSKGIEQSGAANVEDFLKQQLTMNTTAQTSTQGYQSLTGATSAINLRGLGANETLILIDGRRSAGVSLLGSDYQPDINGIPLSAIERIEVLPSSASAIYGGAAVGGVVNIILKRTFDGGEFGYTYDNPFSGHAPLRTVNASYGFSLGSRTQVMLAGSYSDGSPLQLEDRQNLVGRGIATIQQNSPSLLYSTSNPFQGATPNIASADGTYNADYTVFTPTSLTLGDGTPLNSPITSIPAGSGAGSSLASGLLANAGKYNLNLSSGTGLYGLRSPIGTVPTDKSLFATIRQSLFDNVDLFAQFSGSSNSSHATLNPFSEYFPVPSGAPNNPFEQDVSITFPSNVSTPLTTDSVTRSGTLGAVVPFTRYWSAELDYTWSKNSFDYVLPFADQVGLDSALASGAVNPFVDTIENPLNLGGYVGSEMYSGSSTLNDLGLRLSGTVGSLLGGAPTLTIGLEHRKEGTGNANREGGAPQTPESNYQQIFFGQSQSTDSVYAEAQVPLIAEHNDVPAIHSLDLQLAGRTERYTVYTSTPYAYVLPVAAQAYNPPQGMRATIEYTSTNPTLGLKYRPVADLAFRLSYASAFLPPTTAQLLPNPTPLCGPSPCFLITDPKNGESYNINYTSGGNPNLHPQTSKSWDAGLIWEPLEEVLRGVRVNLEYYRISQPNYITNPTVQQVVSDPAFAGRITRDATTGLITTVDTSNVNATAYKTSGWDLNIDYRRSTAVGVIGAHLLGTLIRYDLRQYAINSPFLEYAGFPNDSGEAKIKGNATLSWEYRRWSLAWTATYYSGYWQQNSPGSPDYLQLGPSSLFTDAQGSNTIPSQIYHDIYASYTWDRSAEGGLANRLLSNLSIQLGIKNVFNKVPPFDAYYQPYFYSPYGDARLRDYRITLKKSL